MQIKPSDLEQLTEDRVKSLKEEDLRMLVKVAILDLKEAHVELNKIESEDNNFSGK